MAQVLSDSPGVASPTRPERDGGAELGQKIDALQSKMELGETVGDPSLYSYDSSKDLSGILKEFNGRLFNEQSELYMMPSDEGEFQRLNNQHYAFKLGLDGLYPRKEVVEEILAPREGNDRPTILDLGKCLSSSRLNALISQYVSTGCGSGIWTVEMAKKFPHCDVLGLDLAPAVFKLDDTPSNCRFEIADVNLGMSKYHGHFELIHSRCIGSGVVDYRKMMRDVEACLKPGGLVIFIDGDMGTYEEDLVTPFPVGQDEDEGGDPSKGSWFHRIRREVRAAAIYNGTDCDAIDDSMSEGLWGHELIDPTTVQVASFHIPLGTWAKSDDPDTQQRLLYIGSLIRHTSMGLSRAWHPMLIKHGIPQETLTKWSERIDEEMTSGRLRNAMRSGMTWGRRYTSDEKSAATTHAGGKSVPGPDGVDNISHQSNANELPAGGPTGFKLFDICRSREQAIALADLRRQKASNLPVPAVVRIRNAQTSKPGPT